MLPLGRGAHLSLSGRYNHTSIDNRDRIQPGGGPGSLDGDHAFGRFNPAAGVTCGSSTRSASVYAGYSEGSRAPTSIELGCADPEAALQAAERDGRRSAARSGRDQERRSRRARALQHASPGTPAFSAPRNHDDILFVTSDQTGFGYFRNFGRTLRRGHRARRARPGRAVDARAPATPFSPRRSRARKPSTARATARNDAARDGDARRRRHDRDRARRSPAARPAALFKAFADCRADARASASTSTSSRRARHTRAATRTTRTSPTALYYLGPGSADGYAVVNLGARYRLTRWLQAIGQVNNLFDREYATAAQLGPAGFLGVRPNSPPASRPPYDLHLSGRADPRLDRRPRPFLAAASTVREHLA